MYNYWCNIGCYRFDLHICCGPATYLFSFSEYNSDRLIIATDTRRFKCVLSKINVSMCLFVDHVLRKIHVITYVDSCCMLLKAIFAFHIALLSYLICAWHVLCNERWCCNRLENLNLVCPY